MEFTMAQMRYLVSDVERAVGFYTKALDFVLDTQMGGAFAIVKLGDLELWLSGPQSSAARPMPDGAKPVPGGWNRFVIEVADIESTAARLNNLSASFRGEIVSGPGGKQLLIEDTEGNPIELFEPR
jgi:predicted enzyme related to lactoylglutathione lyase